MDISEWKLEDYAKHYVETLASPPNGLGQHVSMHFGRSDNMLYRMQKEFGEVPTLAAIMAAFRARYPTSGVMEKYGTHSTNA